MKLSSIISTRLCGLLLVGCALAPLQGMALAQVCNLDSESVPKQCLRFKGNCPVLQSCVMDWVLRNEDIKDFDVGTLALRPLEAGAGEVDEHTVFAKAGAPIVVPQSPVIPQACRDDVMLAVSENLAQKKSMPFKSAQQRMQSHMREMKKSWSAKGWSLSPNDVFTHLHECRDVCGAMIARLAQCHIWAVSNAELKSLVTFNINQHTRDHIRESYPMSVNRFVQSVQKVAGSSARQYQVAVIGRASRDGAAAHNYDLSYKRAHTVRDALIGQGLAADSVKLIWLGEQTPQIHPAMVEGYELDGFYRTLGPERELRINRSVMLVAYPLDEPVAVAER